MKYTLRIHKHEHKDVEVFAETPVQAMIKAKEDNPDFAIDNATELLDEDEPGETFEVVGGCEGCSEPILTGDSYYQWEDVMTCLACGGGHKNHQASIA